MEFVIENTNSRKIKMSFYGYIYKTTNVLDNKLYIGKHKGRIDYEYLGSGVYIRHALSKYGKDNFKLEVLVCAENKEKLDELEKKYITEYRNMFGKGNLYNIADGGEGAHSCPHSKEAKEKIKISNCLAWKNRINPMTGKHHSLETKIKMKEAKTKRKYLLGYINSPETRLKLKITSKNLWLKRKSNGNSS